MVELGKRFRGLSDVRRDPKQTSHDGDILLNFLRKTELPVTLASVNYRLSPTVHHPGHQEDVIAALGYLKERYNMNEYVLVGHSAGACLAFQSAHITGCRGILGVEGIYDIEQLVEEYPEYEEFVEQGFGTNKIVWRKASPSHINLNSTTLIIKLVQSTEDELLSPRQTECMFSRLQNMNITLQDIGWIRGSHNTAITNQEFCSLVYDFMAQLLQS